MSPVAWLLRSLAPRVVPWGPGCPAGAPVPASERCAAVDCDSIRLTALAEGDRARVTCLEDAGSGPARRLAALGVLPGTELVLAQRAPAFVLQVGHAELAVDETLAERIRVRREPA
jgi:ferrous iron transport protein A